ncbi:MAG: hypothetical protein ACO3UU_10295 [Minisyncoccia bacterium]
MVNFADKCGILGELWINYKDDKNLGDFKEFIDYNDIGLPLAYLIAQGLIKETTPLGDQYIDESFDMLIAGLEIDEEEIKDDWDLTKLLDYVYKKKGK